MPPKKKTAPAKKTPKGAAKKKTSRAKGAPGARAAEETKEDVLRRMLASKRQDLLKEAREEVSKYIKGENRQLVETALDDGDWSVIDVAEDIILRKLSAHRENILKIEEALRKLDNKTYGSCEECGEDINPERLKILPFAIYCRDCQEFKEKLAEASREESPFK